MAHKPNTDNRGPGVGAMMAPMMVCCLGIALLFLVIPLVGWPVGIAIAAVGAVGMFLFHRRFMRRSH